jgi:hypothetical protein
MHECNAHFYVLSISSLTSWDVTAMDAMEARRAALAERLASNEERKLALEEKKQANEEHLRLVEEERKLFLMDISHMDERQMEYIILAHNEVLAKKRLLIVNMNSPTVGMFGGGMGGMHMFGGGMGGMAGMGGMSAMGGMASMGGMAGMEGFGGMAGMGGPSYGGVSGGTMGVSVSGVCMDPWDHHREDSWPIWILLFLLQPKISMKKKQKKAMTWKMRKCEILSCI